MLELVKSVLKQVLPPTLYHPYRQPSYSQDGEDRILARVFDQQPHGFYVDVGAHHPWRFSNTYLFYHRGWKGINIDAAPGSMRPFHRHRRRDINLEMGVASSVSTLRMYLFDEPALNTFDATRAQYISSLGQFCLRGVQEVPVAPLATILHDHCPAGTKIDFLSVDVEGLDLQVLRSNDWQAYRPQVVVVEEGSDLPALQNSDLVRYMTVQDYRLFAKTATSALFRAVA